MLTDLFRTVSRTKRITNGHPPISRKTNDYFHRTSICLQYTHRLGPSRFFALLSDSKRITYVAKSVNVRKRPPPLPNLPEVTLFRREGRSKLQFLAIRIAGHATARYIRKTRFAVAVEIFPPPSPPPRRTFPTLTENTWNTSCCHPRMSYLLSRNTYYPTVRRSFAYSSLSLAGLPAYIYRGYISFSLVYLAKGGGEGARGPRVPSPLNYYSITCKLLSVIVRN